MEVICVLKRMRLDRIQSIFKMKELGDSNREIAKKCRVSPSTVSATLTLYSHPDENIWRRMCCYEKAKYVWDMQRAEARRKNRFRGHIRDVDKRAYVENKLINNQWSPEIISNKLLEEHGKKLSTKTIYRYVKRAGSRLKQHLYEKGKPRRQRIVHRRGRFKKRESVEKIYIDKRPEIINSREQFGHWEGDLVLGPKKGSGYVLLSLIERKTRFKEFIKLPNVEAKTVLAHLIAFFMKLPEHARRSITFDNGPEFSIFAMNKLKKYFNNLEIYYTETYSPQQKGSDEHSNGRLRRAYPKKTDFIYVPKSELQQEVQKLNDRPMKLHGFKTPQQIFNLELEGSKLKQAA